MDDDIVVVMPWVYILRCGDNTFYVGHSADVESRLHWHRLGFGANHTALRLPVDLAYTEEYASLTDAVTRERQLKHWSGEKKAALIAGDRDRLKQLSKRRCRKINRSKINSFNLDSETSRAYSLRHWRAQSMRWTPMILAAVSLFGSAAALSQGQGQVRAPEVPPTDTIAEDIPGVIRGGTKIEVVIANVPGHGDPGVTLQGTEGPIALPDGTMVFCETILARVARVEKDGKESVFVDAALAGGPNGLTWDPKGRLIGATTAPGKVGVRVVYPKGSEATLADNFEGKPFVRPNDLIADKKGGVYFTDPANAPNPSLPPAVYYLPPGGGKVIKVVDDVNPNGVTLSPDEKILYVNSGGTGYVLAFDVQNDGTLTNRRNFAKYEGLTVTDGKVVGGGDGFTVDTQGRLYTAAAGKIQVFTSQGAYLGSITPSRRPQNLAFAGPDMKTLYVVGGGTVFKVQMLAQGIKSRGGK